MSIIIDDYEYDISSFAKFHPGGHVITYYDGQDATTAFHSFHHNLPKAQLMLSKLRRKKVVKNEMSEMSERSETFDDRFESWRKSLIERGFFTPSYTHVVWRLMEPVVFYVFACFMMKYSLLISILVFAMANVRCGWIQHEAGHTSLTTNRAIDKFIQSATLGFGLSISAYKWNRMHNKHHASPQKLNHDTDLDTVPFVAFSKSCVDLQLKTKNPLVKMWLRFQAWTFLPVVCGGLWLYWVYVMHVKAAYKYDRTSLFFMILSHFVRPGLFVLFGPPGMTWFYAYILFMLTFSITTTFLFGHFSLSHTFTDVIPENEHKKWSQYAIDHSVDISTNNWVVDWLMGYLNYQVIHHLFPSMPQFRHPQVSKELAQLCPRYRRMSYFDAWKHMLTNLNQVGKYAHAHTHTKKN